MRRREFVAAALGAVAVPSVVCAQAPATLRVGATVSDFFGEPYYIEEAGTFARAGFRVEPVPLANAGATTAALAGGSLDLALLDPVSCANAVNRGLPLAMIAGGGLYSSGRRVFILAVANDSPVRAAKDFEGRTIAVPTLGAVSADALQVWLAQRGVDLAKVHLIEMPQGTMVPAVARGTIDGGLLGEPNITMEHGAVRDIGRPMDAVAAEFCVTTWVATRSWIAADRARVEKVIQEIYATARWANAHEDQTLPILARINKQDPKDIRGMARVQYATSLAVAHVQPVLDMAFKFKQIERRIKADELFARI
jgi:NitT/TauT family transport system substrate-binding protein